MNSSTTIAELLGDFDLTPAESTQSTKKGHAVTIWLPEDIKARYDRLQEKSGRQFGKKAKQVLIELIELAEERIA